MALSSGHNGQQSAHLVTKGNGKGGGIRAEGPQPAKRACLPQGLALGARSAPFTLVKMKKLNLIFHIKSLDDSCIAKEILNEQIKHGWPGLAQECSDLCEELDIPDFRSDTCLSKSSWNKMVKKAVEMKIDSCATTGKYG